MTERAKEAEPLEERAMAIRATIRECRARDAAATVTKRAGTRSVEFAPTGRRHVATGGAQRNPS